MNTESVLIISRRPLLAETIRTAIEENTEYEACIASKQESIDGIAEEHSPNIVIIDTQYPLWGRISECFRNHRSRLKIVVISDIEDEMTVFVEPTVESATLGNLIKVIQEHE